MANALASKASVRKDLGVRIPRAPLGNYQIVMNSGFLFSAN